MSETDTSKITVLRAQTAFSVASGGKTAKRPKSYPPFSMRLSDDERAFLDEHAGDRPWAEYIRERVFGADATTRRAPRRPKLNDKLAAQILAELGASRLASNVNQLAKSANMGTIDVSQDIEQQLEEACQAIEAMRDLLIVALGLKP